MNYHRSDRRERGGSERPPRQSCTTERGELTREDGPAPPREDPERGASRREGGRKDTGGDTTEGDRRARTRGTGNQRRGEAPANPVPLHGVRREQGRAGQVNHRGVGLRRDRTERSDAARSRAGRQRRTGKDTAEEERMKSGAMRTNDE